MATPNDFRHQAYVAARPRRVEWISNPTRLSDSDEEFESQMAPHGDRLQTAGLAEIWLIHGTFVGNDAFGWVRTVSRVWPALAEPLLQLNKRAADRVFKDQGNYSKAYAERLQSSLGGAIKVRLLNWSGENHHVGRAEGAIRLLDKLLSFQLGPKRRVLLLAHSHGGNVVALASNLLSASDKARRDFFTAALPHYFRSNQGVCDIPAWRRVREGTTAIDPSFLDVATFGCPIRYGWDDSGYNRLLHFIFHVPQPDLPPFLAKFPPTTSEMQNGASGDVIQQIGVAGTNFTPNVFESRSWLAESRLNRLLQKGQRKRDLLNRLRLGARGHDRGVNLLVDYRPCGDSLLQHGAGHTVYTNQAWMPFHFDEIASRLYSGE